MTTTTNNTTSNDKFRNREEMLDAIVEAMGSTAVNATVKRTSRGDDSYHAFRTFDISGHEVRVEMVASQSGNAWHRRPNGKVRVNVNDVTSYTDGYAASMNPTRKNVAKIVDRILDAASASVRKLSAKVAAEASKNKRIANLLRVKETHGLGGVIRADADTYRGSVSSDASDYRSSFVVKAVGVHADGEQRCDLTVRSLSPEELDAVIATIKEVRQGRLTTS